MSLFLVDGHALAYRSYFAFANQPLVNSKGEETSAVYGFLNTLIALIHKYRPEYLGVAFDSVGKTFRHEMFTEYKAHREVMPESLVSQLPVILAVLDAMRVPYFHAEGYEADDIIATLADRWEGEIPVAIVSGDKDLFQTINDRTHVIRPGRGSVLEDEIGPEGLVARIGLRPDQVVDYLALMGDTSDNVPGVRGVGEKTAKKLLQAYGTLEGVYERLDSVKPPSVQKKLREGRDAAFLSRRLVALRRDVPVDVALDVLKRGDHRTPELRSLLSDLEFERMIEQLFDRPSAPRVEEPVRAPAREAPGVAPEVEYRLVDTEEALQALARELEGASEFAVDVETSGLDAMRAVLAGISVATRPGRAFYVPVESEIVADEGEAGVGGGHQGLLLPAERAPGLPVETVHRHLGAVFAASSPVKIGQNIKYDAIVLANAGLELGGIAFDTMVASYCLDPARRSHGLDALALDLCGHEMIPFASLFPARTRKKDIRTVPLERVKEYACEDADFTLRLKEEFAPMLEASLAKRLFEEVEMPLCGVLTRMEMTGVRVDAEVLGAMSHRYSDEIADLERRIYEAVGESFNINSTQKLREILFTKLGLKPARKTKTGYSTDVDVLQSLTGEHEVVGLILDYRQRVKLKSTYIDALPRLVHPESGRVHTSYNQAVATTGRLSSSDPNLQNIPIRTAQGREIRRAFASRGPGWVLLDADYSQIELRILAHLSGDGGLVRAFLDDADVHRRTAAKVMGVGEDEVTDDMRARAKTVNFGIIYGMGARGLAQSLGIEVDEARRFIDDYFRSYPGVKRFIDDTIAAARRDHAIGTLLGRIRRLPDIDSSNRGLRSFSERIAVNTPVQGTAADVIKLAMVAIDREIAERGLDARMILQVHDELLFDVPEGELDAMRELVRRCMETALEMEVPLKVDMGVGSNWLEAH
jgi:DNA polymerase-1